MGYYDEDYLAHHGILGMKWGIRRYQNKDGSLTAAGKARMDEVANSKTQSKLNTSQARAVYKNNARTLNSYAVSESRKSVKYANKAGKYAKGTDKNKELMNKSKESAEKSKAYSIMASIATKKIRDLDEGSIKAGRDFIVQKDLNMHILMPAAYYELGKSVANPKVGKMTTINPWLGSVDYTVIEKKK